VAESISSIRPVRYEEYELPVKFDSRGLPAGAAISKRGIHVIKTLSRARVPFKPKDSFSEINEEELTTMKRRFAIIDARKRAKKQSEVELLTSREMQSSRAQEMFNLGYRAMP
jgi:hypothetical protein